MFPSSSEINLNPQQYLLKIYGTKKLFSLLMQLSIYNDWGGQKCFKDLGSFCQTHLEPQT